MKVKILGIVLSLFCCIAVNATPEDIPLYGSTKDECMIDNRSLSIILQATYDENTICIYSNVATSNITIAIKDEAENIIYSNTDVASSRCHIFYISDLPQGCYLLEIEDNSFYGYFLKY